MKLTKEEKELLHWLISKTTKNVLTGNNKKLLSTDESLIFSFDYENMKTLLGIETKLAKEV